MTFVRLIPFVLPPLLGAVIGYVTNFLAIRMLFRPLTEKRLFGVRIPFTPGIIPRQRYQLSESIALMVSTKLLTPDALEGKLDDPTFLRNLTASVSRFTSEVLDRVPGTGEPTGNIDGNAAGNLAERSISGSAGDFSILISTLLRGFLSSDAFKDSARRIVVAAVDGALNLTVAQVTPRSETIAHTVGRALSAASSGIAAGAIRDAVVRWVSNHVENDTPLNDVLGSETLARLGELLPRSYDPILESLLTFLRQPDTREELDLHGRVLMQRILKRLSLFQRLVVSATQYDRNLIDNMPAIVTDVIDSLEHAGRNPENKVRIVAIFKKKLAEWGESGVGSLGDSLKVNLPEIARRAVSAGLDLLSRPDVIDRVSGSIMEFLERRGSDSLEEVLRDTLGVGEGELKDRAVALVERWLAQPDASARIAAQVSQFVQSHLSGTRSAPLRATISLSEEDKASMDSLLAVRLRDQLELRVPELIESLDVHGMVVQKIDGLDVESVEQLLLMVIARHLKWINLFGALLGSIIGGVQVLVSQLT